MANISHQTVSRCELLAASALKEKMKQFVSTCTEDILENMAALQDAPAQVPRPLPQPVEQPAVEPGPPPPVEALPSQIVPLPQSEPLVRNFGITCYSSRSDATNSPVSHKCKVHSLILEVASMCDPTAIERGEPFMTAWSYRKSVADAMPVVGGASAALTMALCLKQMEGLGCLWHRPAVANTDAFKYVHAACTRATLDLTKPSCRSGGTSKLRTTWQR
jgi:hypothetical protein